MRNFTLGLIKLYQKYSNVGPTCRYTPTCSEYTRQAVEKYGVGRGLVLGGRRVLRCHPLSRGGWDPLTT